MPRAWRVTALFQVNTRAVLLTVRVSHFGLGKLGSRDADLLRLPDEPLAAAANEQPARADHPRDQAKNTSGRSFPGRSLGADAGRRQAPAHRLNQVGTTALNGNGKSTESGKTGGSRLTFR